MSGAVFGMKMDRLVLEMKTCHEEVNWATIPIISRVNGQLIIQRHIKALKNFEIIIGLHDIF
jgi:hypothetical protein